MLLHLGNEQGLAYYNYRRWIWIMLPWIAISYQGNFSSVMAKYCPSDTKTVTILQEKKIYLKSLSIAAEVKRQRQQIMEHKLDKLGNLPRHKTAPKSSSIIDIIKSSY
jgi:hypothetical protein